MEIEVHYFGNFRDLAKKKEQKIRLSNGATVKDMLNCLAEEYNRLQKLLFKKDRSLNDYILIMRNNRRIKDTGERLNDRDKIYLMVAISGG